MAPHQPRPQPLPPGGAAALQAWMKPATQPELHHHPLDTKEKKKKGLLAPPPSRPRPLQAPPLPITPAAAELRSRGPRCLNLPQHGALSLSAASALPGTGVRRRTLRGPAHRRAQRLPPPPRSEAPPTAATDLASASATGANKDESWERFFFCCCDSSWFPFQRFSRLAPLTSRGA